MYEKGIKYAETRTDRDLKSHWSPLRLEQSKAHFKVTFQSKVLIKKGHSCQMCNLFFKRFTSGELNQAFCCKISQCTY